MGFYQLKQTRKNTLVHKPRNWLQFHQTKALNAINNLKPNGYRSKNKKVALSIWPNKEMILDWKEQVTQ